VIQLRVQRLAGYLDNPDATGRHSPRTAGSVPAIRRVDDDGYVYVSVA
jgi:hypothetical protein